MKPGLLRFVPFSYVCHSQPNSSSSHTCTNLMVKNLRMCDQVGFSSLMSLFVSWLNSNKLVYRVAQWGKRWHFPIISNTNLHTETSLDTQVCNQIMWTSSLSHFEQMMRVGLSLVHFIYLTNNHNFRSTKMG